MSTRPLKQRHSNRDEATTVSVHNGATTDNTRFRSWWCSRWQIVTFLAIIAVVSVIALKFDHQTAFQTEGIAKVKPASLSSFSGIVTESSQHLRGEVNEKTQKDITIDTPVNDTSPSNHNDDTSTVVSAVQPKVTVYKIPAPTPQLSLNVTDHGEQDSSNSLATSEKGGTTSGSEVATGVVDGNPMSNTLESIDHIKWAGQNTDSSTFQLDELEVAPTRRYHIFQFSSSGVASTLTVNILLGLFEGTEQAMAYWECKGSYERIKEGCTFWQRLNRIRNRQGPELINNTIVTKTHVIDVDMLQSWFHSDFDNIFFVGNERKDRDGLMLPKEYCANDTYPNVMCLQYEDLLYDDEEGLRKVVKYVKDRIYESFPYFAHVVLKEKEAVQRLLDMAESYKGNPRYNSDRYGIGGGNAKNHTLEVTD